MRQPKIVRLLSFAIRSRKCLRILLYLARYLCRVMRKRYTIGLDSLDLFQLIDGLEMRAESWEKTAEFLRTGYVSSDNPFIAEECHKPEEADDIAEHYRAIVRTIRQQMEAQE